MEGSSFTRDEVESLLRESTARVERRMERKQERHDRVRDNREVVRAMVADKRYKLPPLSQSALVEEFHDFDGREGELTKLVEGAIRSKRRELDQYSSGVRGLGMSRAIESGGNGGTSRVGVHEKFLESLGITDEKE